LKVAEEVGGEDPASCAPETPVEAMDASATEPEVPSVDNAASTVEQEKSGAESADVAQPADEPAAPRNLSLHASAIPLSLKPEMSINWPLSRKRQLFNVFYFGLITLQLVALVRAEMFANGLNAISLYLTTGVCGFFSLASIFYLFNHRAHQTPTDELSPRARRSLRAFALLLPAFLLMGFMRYTPQDVFEPIVPTSVATAFDAEMNAGKRDYNRHRYGPARTHFERAAVLDPQSDSAFEWVANANDSLRDSTAAITAGLRAVYLNPENENANVILSHAYNMSGNYKMGLEHAQRAAALSPEDGEAYGNMSDSFIGLGQMDNALTAANSHVKYHNYEAQSFDQRARILEALGRNREASYDRQISSNIRWGRADTPH